MRKIPLALALAATLLAGSAGIASRAGGFVIGSWIGGAS